MFSCGDGFVKRVIKENGSLRGLLSVLGVAIGLFSMVMVKCAVDSLSLNILSGLGTSREDVLYITRIPFSTEEAESDYEYDWWDYLRRPDISFSDYQSLDREGGSVMNLLYVKSLSSDISTSYKGIGKTNILLMSSSMIELINLKIKSGRLMSSSEFERGSNVCMLPENVSRQLFGEISPIGKEVIVNGVSLDVVAITEETSAGLVSLPGLQNGVVVPVKLAYRICGNMDGGMIISVPQTGIPKEFVADRIKTILRSVRGIAPSEKDNFSVNEISYLRKAMESLFARLELIGNMIGGVSLVIGAFGIINIMFVSVYQRRFVIGVKKAIGARKWVIIREFVLESIVLSFIGGVLAVATVALVTILVNSLQDSFHLYILLNNVLYGFGISIMVGIAAGSIPAWKAAKTDPVKVMRQN